MLFIDSIVLIHFVIGIPDKMTVVIITQSSLKIGGLRLND
jgi:hypothetical protein